jgi:hypothetical protein
MAATECNHLATGADAADTRGAPESVEELPANGAVPNGPRADPVIEHFPQ